MLKWFEVRPTTDVHIRKCDVAKRGEVDTLLASGLLGGSVLEGVLHAAGALGERQALPDITSLTARGASTPACRASGASRRHCS